MLIVPLATSLFLFFRKNKNHDETEGKENVWQETSLLCRFVVDGTGKKVGESIAVNEDIIIIKSGNKYLGVPLKHIEDDGKNMLVKGLVDYSKAEELGEHWRKESFRELNQPENHEGKNNGF